MGKIQEFQLFTFVLSYMVNPTFLQRIPCDIWDSPLIRRPIPQPKFVTKAGVFYSDTTKGHNANV